MKRKIKESLLMLCLFSFCAVIGINPTPAQTPPSKPSTKFADLPKPMPAAEAVPTDTKAPGPVFCAAVRSHLRKEFRKQGMGFLESIKKANQVSDEMIAGLMPDAEKVASASLGQDVKVGAIGDGKILDAIIAFFNSPQGQALMEALIKLLIGFLAEAPPAQFWHSALASFNA